MSDRDLQRGVVVDRRVLGAVPARAGLASGRATGGSFGPSFGWPLAIVLAGLAVATPFALAARRS